MRWPDMDVIPTTHRITVEEFLRMGEAGIFDEDARIELLDGDLVEMSPIGDRHAKAVFRLTEYFSRLSPLAAPSVQNPLVVSGVSLPQPDVVLLRKEPDPYRQGHPHSEDVHVVVEVADSSIETDRRLKLPLYAQAGIREVWIVDLDGEEVEVHRDPQGPRYRDTSRFGRNETVSPVAFPDLSVPVAALL